MFFCFTAGALEEVLEFSWAFLDRNSMVILALASFPKSSAIFSSLILIDSELSLASLLNMLKFCFISFNDSTLIDICTVKEPEPFGSESLHLRQQFINSGVPSAVLEIALRRI